MLQGRELRVDYSDRYGASKSGIVVAINSVNISGTAQVRERVVVLLDDMTLEAVWLHEVSVSENMVMTG